MSEVNVNINIEGYATDQELTDGLATKVTKNANITGATKTKITYDEKGLVTAGSDATTADIADSSNKRYVTDAQLTVIGNTSGTNTGDQDLSGYQLTSQKNQAGGYLGITAGNVVSLPNGMGFISLNVTPNQIAYFDNSGNLLTLSTVTYASILELSYVKGLTSSVQTQLDARVFKNAVPAIIQLACSDETTALTTGTAKITFRMPHAMTLTEVRASLNVAGTTSGITTIDINEGGVSILSTKLTIDLTEKTSVTATTPAVISDATLADDAEITVDIDAISGGATEKGLKITLIGTRSI